MHIIVSPPSLANKQTPRESLFHGKRLHDPRQEPPETKKETLPGIFNPFSFIPILLFVLLLTLSHKICRLFYRKARIA